MAVNIVVVELTPVRIEGKEDEKNNINHRGN
jgi:hypothetical protein